jgi:dCTP deaminase
VLGDSDIRSLAQEAGLISEFEEASLQGASYDLRLGSEYFMGGAHLTLTKEQPSCLLAPGEFAILTSLERLKLPDTLVGHAGLGSPWAQRGLVSLFSPQIDPGFEGLIVVPLFNAGNSPVTLKLGEPMFTAEFVRTTCPTRSWTLSHHALDAIPAAVELDMARPDFGDLEKQINELREGQTKLEARLDGYEAGQGKRVAISGTQAAWFGAAMGAIAIVVAVLALVN